MLLCVRFPEIPWLEYLTIYADDIAVCLEVNEIADIPLVAKLLRLLFEHLSLHKLLVNFSKTVVLLQGLWKAHAQNHRPVHVVKQGERYLRVSEHCDLLVVQNMVYLGFFLTLGSCSKSVSEWRGSKARASFMQFRSWWRSPYLSVKQRVQLYRAVVVPTLMHGLGAVGLSSSEARRMDTLIIKHLRWIYRSPAHVTRESNADLLSRVDIMVPSVLINIACLRLLAQMVKAETILL